MTSGDRFAQLSNLRRMVSPGSQQAPRRGGNPFSSAGPPLLQRSARTLGRVPFSVYSAACGRVPQDPTGPVAGHGGMFRLHRAGQWVSRKLSTIASN